MKELRAELDENVEFIGNTSATFRYLMHIDSAGLMSLMSWVKFGDQKWEMATEHKVKGISEMDWKAEQICHSGKVSTEPEWEQMEGIVSQDFGSGCNPCISWS